MITLRKLLTPDELASLADRLDAETFVDGGETAFGRAKERKNNLQLPAGSDAVRELDKVVRAAFERHEYFRAAVMPTRILPMRFSRYETGMGYGWHIDDALMADAAGRPMRTDLACTVFLADPASYDGGELTIQTRLGNFQAKLPAGDAVVYPATTVHRVEPVTRGVRQVAVTWIQSTVASTEQRDLLLDLLASIREVGRATPDSPEIERLANVHRNLIRMWGQP